MPRTPASSTHGRRCGARSFRDLRLFAAAIAERSVTAAAQRRNATRSGVSQHSRKLEARLGVLLFPRGSVAVAPTAAGEDFHRHAIGLLRARDAAMRSVRAHTGTLHGEIKAGLMPTMTRLCLAATLARSLDAQPNVLLRITKACSVALPGMVRAGEIDFAVVPAPVASLGLRSAPFLPTPEVLVPRRDFGQPHLHPVGLRSLPPPRLVLPGPRDARRQSIELRLANLAIRPERTVELDAMLGTLDLVATQGWMTILPGVMTCRA